MSTIKQAFKLYEDNHDFLSALGYIQHLASMTNTNITRWNITSLLKDEESEEEGIVTNKNEINKRFFEKMQTVVASQAKEEYSIDSIPGLSGTLDLVMSRHLEGRKQDLKYGIENGLINVRRFHRRMCESLRALTKQKIELDKLSGVDPAQTIKQEISSVLKEGYWTNPVLDSSYNTLYLNTKSDIVISHKNKAALVDIELNVGQLAIKVDLNSMNMWVIPYKKNIRRHNFFHPHIDTNGAICWGDAYVNVANWQAGFNLADILKVLYSLLHNYNDGNPYIDIYDLKTNGNAYGRCSNEMMHPDKRAEAEERAKKKQEKEQALFNESTNVVDGATIGTITFTTDNNF